MNTVNKGVSSTNTQRVTNVKDVWNTLGRCCTHVAGSLGTKPTDNCITGRVQIREQRCPLQSYLGQICQYLTIFPFDIVVAAMFDII